MRGQDGDVEVYDMVLYVADGEREEEQCDNEEGVGACLPRPGGAGQWCCSESVHQHACD